MKTIVFLQEDLTTLDQPESERPVGRHPSGEDVYRNPHFVRAVSSEYRIMEITSDHRTELRRKDAWWQKIGIRYINPYLER